MKTIRPFPAILIASWTLALSAASSNIDDIKKLDAAIARDERAIEAAAHRARAKDSLFLRIEALTAQNATTPASLAQARLDKALAELEVDAAKLKVEQERLQRQKILGQADISQAWQANERALAEIEAHRCERKVDFQRDEAGRIHALVDRHAVDPGVAYEADEELNARLEELAGAQRALSVWTAQPRPVFNRR